MEFNVYQANGIGGVGIAVGTNGAIAAVHSTGPVAINSGDVIGVNLTHLKNVLTINLTDTTTSAQFTLATNVNIPTQLGTNLAYVGFTGSDGAAKAFQLVTGFSFISVPSLSITATNTTPTISWTSSVGNYILQQNSSLLTTNWVTVTNVPTVTNGQNQITVAPVGTAEFYRLTLH